MVGCGWLRRGDRIALSIRPSQAEFPAVKAALIELAVHALVAISLGDFKLDPDDNSAANLDEEYQLAKGFVDLDDPDASILVRVGLKVIQRRRAIDFCFENADACAYRKVDA